MPEKGKVEVLINRQERKKTERGEERFEIWCHNWIIFGRKAKNVCFAIETKKDFVGVLVTENFQTVANKGRKWRRDKGGAVKKQ